MTDEPADRRETGSVSRRSLFKAAGAVGVAATVPSPAPAQGVGTLPTPTPPAQPDPVQPDRIHFFLMPAEAAFLAAAVDRLIPPDETWPGAASAGVTGYIDRQLAGGYGQGARMYLAGPWQEGEPEQGYQLRYTPAEVFRIGIAATQRHVADTYGGRAFEDLAPELQDEVLTGLETGAVNFPELPAPIFFETLLAKTVEGFFADPAYGGNRDMVGWRMIGYPGAYGQYAYLVENWGMAYERPPMSMAHSAFTRHDHDD